MQEDSTHVQPHHAAEAHREEANPQGGEVFTYLLKGLGDHHELKIFFGSYKILPIILVDNGFHVYSNEHTMEEAGQYTLHEGHPVRTSDGGHPALDLSITNFVAYEFIAMALMLIFSMVVRATVKKDPLKAPSGLANAIEAMVTYVRDEMVVPNVGTKKRATTWMPYFLALFFFILILNLIGLMPGCHAATGSLAVTTGLALTSFVLVNFIAMKDAGVGNWFKHLLGGAPLYIAPIMVPIEIVSLFTKPFALTIRLFANMTAGHVVLLSLVGLIFFFQSFLVAPVSVAFSVFIYMLELLVAVLQAYIFTMLTAVFVGLALGDHAKDDHHVHAH